MCSDWSSNTVQLCPVCKWLTKDIIYTLIFSMTIKWLTSVEDEPSVVFHLPVNLFILLLNIVAETLLREPMAQPGKHMGLHFWGNRNRIVIVNSRFLERPQKRCRGNQLIHRRLTRTKSTVKRAAVKILRVRQADSQTLRWVVFGVETGREVRRRGRTRIGFAKEQRFQFGVKEPWRDGNHWQGERFKFVHRMGRVFINFGKIRPLKQERIHMGG